MIEGYSFDWNNLGDIKAGRGNLGMQMPVAMYRLMQYTIVDILTQEYGKEKMQDLIRRAGRQAGLSFTRNLLDTTLEINAFLGSLQKTLKDMKIGILRVERMDLSTLTFVLTVDEDLDCSGLPVAGETVCFYDEGFIAGILEAYTGKAFSVQETDCWASGGLTCRFVAVPVK